MHSSLYFSKYNSVQLCCTFKTTQLQDERYCHKTVFWLHNSSITMVRRRCCSVPPVAPSLLSKTSIQIKICIQPLPYVPHEEQQLVVGLLFQMTQPMVFSPSARSRRNFFCTWLWQLRCENEWFLQDRIQFQQHHKRRKTLFVSYPEPIWGPCIQTTSTIVAKRYIKNPWPCPLLFAYLFGCYCFPSP